MFTTAGYFRNDFEFMYKLLTNSKINFISKWHQFYFFEIFTLTGLTENFVSTVGF